MRIVDATFFRSFRSARCAEAELVSVANADSLFATNDSELGRLAGPFPGSFDWGLPFFYGRNVFTAIEGKSTPQGSGPYWAF